MIVSFNSIIAVQRHTVLHIFNDTESVCRKKTRGCFSDGLKVISYIRKRNQVSYKEVLTVFPDIKRRLIVIKFSLSVFKGRRLFHFDCKRIVNCHCWNRFLQRLWNFAGNSVGLKSDLKTDKKKLLFQVLWTSEVLLKLEGA